MTGPAVYRPWRNKVLADYMTAVYRHYRVLAMLGIPDPADQKVMLVEDLWINQRVRVGSEEPVWLAKLLTEQPRVAVIGEAGSGKSTLISWLVSQVATQAPTPVQEVTGPMVPLPVILRDMTIDPEITTFDELLDALPQGPRWSTAVRAELDFEGGHVWVLLDGLDEVFDAHARDAVRAAIDEGQRRYAKCRFLVTSRPLAWANERMRKADELLWIPTLTGMTEAWLQPFDKAQILGYAQRWYAVRLGSRSAEAPERAADLEKVLSGDPHLAALAGNPSLLTLILIVHRSATRLPSGRAVLFEKIVEAYLEGIDRARKLPGGPVSPGAHRRYLSALARKMQVERLFGTGGLDIHGTDAENCVQGAARSEGRPLDADQARALIAATTERSGLLIPRAEGVLAFTHLSFQDYFSACWFADELKLAFFQSVRAEAAVGELRRWVEKPAARETMIFLFECFAETPGFGDGLIEKLFDGSGEGYDYWDATGGLAQALLDDEGSGLTERGRGVCEARVTTAVREATTIEIEPSVHRPPEWAKSLDQLKGLPLAALRLNRSRDHLDLSPLANVPGLRELLLKGVHVDAAPKLPLTTLLGVVGTPAGGCKQILRCFPRVASLYVAGDDLHFTIDDAFTGLPDLRILGVGDRVDGPVSHAGVTTAWVSNTANLGDLPEMQRIVLVGSLPELRRLLRYPKLREIELQDCALISDLSPLADHPNSGTVTIRGATSVPHDHPTQIGRWTLKWAD